MQNSIVSKLPLPDGDALSIKRGLTDAQINQLIEYSKTDPDLKKFTGDPERFATREGFDEFSKHIMVYYALVDDSDNLKGIIWFDDFAFLARLAQYGHCCYYHSAFFDVIYCWSLALRADHQHSNLEWPCPLYRYSCG